METKVTKDGFVWLVVPDNYAMEMWKANLATLYVLHNDDSETMVETDLQMADAIHDGERIGIEVGFIKGLLPACPQCGSRMFWFDKENPLVLFTDIRDEEHTLCDGRSLKVHPDIVSDFTNMPFLNESFKLVVFDPPHLLNVGKESWLAKKYGKLPEDWPRVIKKGIDECFRVLENYGVLIFKWNEDQITVKEVLKAIGRQPLFGHTTGRHGKTMWMCFMKLPINE